MRHFVSRLVVLVVMMAFGSACDGQQVGRDVVGVENRCGAALEVSVGDTESSQRWISVAVGTWEKVSTVERGGPILFWVRAAGDMSMPKAVQLEAADVVKSVGGPLDLLIVVQGAECPA